jgi:Gram-negative bacterial TonB protein C-terminal
VLTTKGAVLEIPVTIQGAKPVEGSDRRELFTETTKTTLVFENGAVLNLKSKVSLGQCVFLRNDQSGKEILCKVLQWRQGGETGYADLEFTNRDPEFWGMHAEQPTAAGQKPEAQIAIEAAGKSPLATPSTDSCTPTSGEMSPSFLGTAPIAPACSAGQTTEALPQPATEAEWNNMKGAELLAALFAEGTEPNSGREMASKHMPESGEANPDTASEARVSSILASGTRQPHKFGTRKNLIAVAIAASVVVAVVLGGAWHSERGSSIHRGDRLSAASVQSRQHELSATAHPSQAPASAVATGKSTTAGMILMNTANSRAGTEVHEPGNNAGAAPVQAAQMIPEASVAQEPRAAGAQPSPPTMEDPEAARNGSSAADSTATDVSKTEAISSVARSDLPALSLASLEESNKPNPTITTPAKIVSQTPPTIPPWAKGLDTDAVVQLDALIDEKGNVAQTKPLSGPRVLQHEAERAVTLWIFEPALSDGKPTATHMVLTVQFQR